MCEGGGKLVGLAAPLGVIAIGCAWLVALLSAVPETVYFSGDGGLKALMVRQLLAGDWAPWLALDEPRWVRALWEGGMYPFRPPFAHVLDGRWYSSFEWALPTLSAPAYALAGDRGLYVLPVLGLIAVWARFVLLLRTLRVGAVPSTVALALLVFATPLTFYGATFWEHTPAVALAFAGYADLILLEQHPRRSRALRAGLLLGLACWLRPEAMVFGASALAAQLSSSRGAWSRWRASRSPPSSPCTSYSIAPRTESGSVSMRSRSSSARRTRRRGSRRASVWREGCAISGSNTSRSRGPRSRSWAPRWRPEVRSARSPAAPSSWRSSPSSGPSSSSRTTAECRSDPDTCCCSCP